MWSTLCLLALSSTRALALWRDPMGWKDFRDGRDMQHFVTRPELKAPRYMVAKHIPEAIEPGYWFVTPYTRVGVPPTTEQKDYMPCMNGAHIYDGDGELVWSGACKYDNRNVFNFRPVHINGTDLLTFFLPGEEHGFTIQLNDRLPSGILMNNNYEEISRTSAKGALLDGHEFNIMGDGKSTLLTTLKAVEADASSIGQISRRVMNTGFQETEMLTARLIFSWDPVSAGVPLNESCDTTGMAPPAKEDPAPWDFFHINSVDKFADGDYLVSSRHMSTLYKISKDDGHIVWQLGGCWGNSDFVMEEGLPFFWQHHARVLSQNETHTIISVFDNASEDKDRGEPFGQNPPAGKIMILDTASRPMTANMLRVFNRPDGGQTAALGSVTVVGDKSVETGNILINWAFDGYISEYDWKDGVNRLVMEAKFVSDRKRSYRAYKFPFTAYPSEPPVLVVLPVGYGLDGVASAFYVSWNGATEVKEWVFYGGESPDESSMRTLQKVRKRGFETQWIMPVYVQYAYAEAIDQYGRSLGRTAVTTITPGVDEHYHISYPALKDSRIVTEYPQQVVDSAGDLAAYGDSSHPPLPRLLWTPSGQQKSSDQCEWMISPRQVDHASFMVVDAFAVFGLYYAVKLLFQRFRRRSGYSSLPKYMEEGK